MVADASGPSGSIAENNDVGRFIQSAFAIAAPTLVIHGETDKLIPPENAKILAERIKGARLVMLPHASHVFITDQTEATVRAITEFLQARSSERRQAGSIQAG
jgi:pimeloyl-ACP methyl ester carboxylesterase